MVEFELNNEELLRLVSEWKLRLLSLPEEVIGNRRNIQNRTIKQIVGHMVDSASNNTHRIIHLQYNSFATDLSRLCQSGKQRQMDCHSELSE